MELESNIHKEKSFKDFISYNL
ncbi:hypothetical protein CCAN2_1560013 [Capnocytophaga canimorsus]|nr:hypothetical protein CCAN2_1560013 [Capnocytophaga canimorsus]